MEESANAFFIADLPTMQMLASHSRTVLNTSQQCAAHVPNAHLREPMLRAFVGNSGFGEFIELAILWKIGIEFASFSAG